MLDCPLQVPDLSAQKPIGLVGTGRTHRGSQMMSKVHSVGSARPLRFGRVPLAYLGHHRRTLFSATFPRRLWTAPVRSSPS
jgi:hypothetical protein